MSDNFFKVFKEEKDHYDWKKIIEYASIIDDVDEDLRRRYVEALVFLEKELGKGFLKSCQGNSHPFYSMLMNRADWQIIELIGIVDVLSKVKVERDNYEVLISKIRTILSCRREGLNFINIASYYLKEDFDVRFEPMNNTGKNPDIEITKLGTGEQLYIEISRLEENPEREITSKIHQTLFGKLHLSIPVYPYWCKQLEYISNDEISSILETIQNFKDRITLEQDFIYHKDNKIELAMTHSSKLNLLEEWTIAYNKKMYQIEGLALDFDDTNRISRKLEYKVKQIPAGKSGLIYIQVNPLHFIVAEITKSINSFQRKMEKHSNIFGIVIYSYMLTGDKANKFEVEGDDCFYSEKTYEGGLCRPLFFVKNKNWETNLKEETIQSIYRTLK